MELYVKMTDEEYEKFKVSKDKNKYISLENLKSLSITDVLRFMGFEKMNSFDNTDYQGFSCLYYEYQKNNVSCTVRIRNESALPMKKEDLQKHY